MKKYIVLWGLLFPSLFVCFAQVSINTQNSQGIFYIDAGADNTTTSVNRFKNDVVVDEAGSLILGQSTQPTVGKAKLDITSDTPYGAFKMVDGGEGDGMVLLGDASGYAKWGMLKGSGGYKLRVTGPTAVMTSLVTYNFTLSNGLSYIPISVAGSYIIMIRMTATYRVTTGTGGRASGYFIVYKNTITPATAGEDSTENYFAGINGQKFTVYTFLKVLNASAGDKLYLVLRPQTANNQWTLDTALTTVFFYRV